MTDSPLERDDQRRDDDEHEDEHPLESPESLREPRDEAAKSRIALRNRG